MTAEIRHLPAGSKSPTITEPRCWPVSASLPTDWRPWSRDDGTATPAPAGLSADELRRELAEIDAACRPADQREFLVVIERLFAFAKTFGMPGDVRAAVGFYHAELGEFPARAIAEAIEAVLTGWTNGHRLPMPAEVKAAIPAAYWRTRSEAMRVRKAIEAIESGNVASTERPAPARDAADVLTGLVRSWRPPA